MSQHPLASLLSGIRLALALAAILLVSWLAAPTAKADDIIDVLDRSRDSVGALYAREAGGDMNFLCSATAIDRHEGQTVVLTANHCLRKGVAYMINFGDGVMRPLVAWKIPHYDADKDSDRKFNEPATDMALFLMAGDDVPLLQTMTSSSGVVPGQRIAMVGYPLGVAKIGYEGIVAGRFDLPGNDHHGYILLQIFGAPGSSGSSVIDVDSGEIIGILVSARQQQVGLPVIFATPIEYRRHLAAVREEDAPVTVGAVASDGQASPQTCSGEEL